MFNVLHGRFVTLWSLKTPHFLSISRPWALGSSHLEVVPHNTRSMVVSHSRDRCVAHVATGGIEGRISSQCSNAPRSVKLNQRISRLTRTRTVLLPESSIPLEEGGDSNRIEGVVRARPGIELGLHGGGTGMVISGEEWIKGPF